MKVLLFLCGFAASLNLYAQTPKAIESDLVNSYKKLPYWATRYQYDSLEKANEILGRKLMNYASQYPFTITYPFPLLKKDLDVLTSNDGRFRIYSWDMLTGGTMHYFANVFQYRTGLGASAILDMPVAAECGVSYYKLYTFKTNNKTYYLAVWLAIGSTNVGLNGIKVYAVNNGKLNDDIKLIKTSSGMHNQLHYEYDDGWDEKFDISFDDASKTIQLPLVSASGKPTSKGIIYKFTGQYFEKVGTKALTTF